MDLSRAATGAPWEARGIVPARVARPADALEVAGLLRECMEGGKPVIPVGAGTALGSGGLPTGPCGLALVTDAMAGIVEHAPADLTLTVRGGTSFEEIRSVVRKCDQRLPGLPGGTGTIGGLLASGWTAATAREAHGALRERLLGVQVAEPRGQLTRSGGRVVKNVTGYDLHRMHAGAGGALGILTELAFRLEPQPESRRVVGLAAPSWNAAQQAWRWLRAQGPEPSFFLVRASGEGLPILTAGLEGDDEPTREAAAVLAAGWRSFGSVTGKALEAEEAGDDAGADPIDPPRAFGTARLKVTLRARPSLAIAAYEETRIGVLVRGLALESACLPHAGEIRLAVGGRPEEVARLLGDLASGAARGGPAYRVEDEWPALPAHLPRWSADPSALRMMARVKRALDPSGVLRPGSYSADSLESAANFFDGARGESS